MEGVPPEVFFALLFDGQTPQGTVVFHDGFKAVGGDRGGSETLAGPPPSPVWSGTFASPAMRSSISALALTLLSACTAAEKPMDTAQLQDFATRYTAAWCSQDAASVAAFFAEGGSLTINAGTPSVGRAAITASAQSFMTAFPDLIVAMDSLVPAGDLVRYHWTLTGTNTGPGGTGNPVRISGFEEWRFGPDGLVAESQGHFNAAEYERQLRGGPTP